MLATSLSLALWLSGALGQAFAASNCTATGQDRSWLLLQQRARTNKQAALQSEQNWYYKAEEFGEAKVGAWGGSCRCPNGEVYQVGDNWNNCGSLACVGGEPSECEKVDRNERRGMKVRCDTPAPPPPTTPPPGQHSREATRFLSWNVYYANDLINRAGRIADAILEVDPEIVSLQELWDQWDEILGELNQKSSGEIWEFARGGETEKVWDGDFVFRRDLWTLEDSGVHKFEERGISWAVLHRRSDYTGVVVLGTHPWCCTNDEPILKTVQNDILQVIKEQRARHPDYPVALLGDMNANFWAGSQFLLRDGRRYAHNQQWDILPYTFQDSYNINGNNPDQSTGFGVKIDFVYFEQSPLHMGQVVDSKIWQGCDKAGSDHCGVSGDVVLISRGTTPPPTTTISTTTTTTSTTTTSAPAWSPIDGGSDRACRGSSSTDNKRLYYKVVSADTLQDCQTLCQYVADCKGVEYSARGKRCEVWTRSEGIGASAPVDGFVCMKKDPSLPTLAVPQSFEPVDGGENSACRGEGGKNLPQFYRARKADTLKLCQGLCALSEGCLGMEWSFSRCEIWTSPIETAVPLDGFQCHRATGASVQTA